MKTEKQLLRPLPAQHFLMQDYKWVTVNLSGHVKLSDDKHYYSVPAELVGKKVEIQYSHETVEVYHKKKVFSRLLNQNRTFSQRASRI